MSGRGRGRPSNAEGPAFPRVEVDRLLVHGEVVLDASGSPSDVYYPTHQEIAEMFNVSRSMISTYAKKHNCQRRRKQATERLFAKVDREVLEARAQAMALRKEDELRIIDAYLRGFEEAVEEGRVSFNSPSDFNTMLRLKSFINGGADSRQEIHTTISLEDMQARHQQTLKAQRASGVVRGEVSVDAQEPATPSPASPRSASEKPPPVNSAPEPNGH